MYTRRIMRLVFDFDGTIVTKDTISTLAQASIAAKKRQQHHVDLQTRWTTIEGEYMRDYKEYKENYNPSANERKSLAQELKYLSGFRAVEEASIKRVHESGIFRNLTTTSLFDMGKQALSTNEVEIRLGFREILALAAEKKWEVSVLSINWSKAFLEGILSSFGDLRIVANEISVDDGTVHGPLQTEGHRMTCSEDKLVALHKMVGSTGRDVVYFGDSTTDIQCLLHGQGVAIGNATASLISTLKRIGKDVPHTSETVTGKVCWAENFQQVIQSGVLENWNKQTQ